MDQAPERVGADLTAVRQLSEQLRGQGVVVVAGRALAAARPEGMDILTTLPVLSREVADEWLEAADQLSLLDVDRLQLRSAAALLRQAAVAAGADAVRVDALDEAQVARAVALRAAVNPQVTANDLLDRTWAVLHDLRSMIRDDDSAAPGADDVVALGLVPSIVDVHTDLARSLPPALNRAACAGALVGMLAPWLPPAGHDSGERIDALMRAVAAMARVAHDEHWRQAMTTVARVAASISIAAAYVGAGVVSGPAQALSLALSEPALGVLVDQATRAAESVAGTGGEADRTAHLPTDSPTASPSQQARAAAERAAAERRATQQAFMERAAALRAASRQGQQSAAASAIPTQQGAPGQPGVPVQLVGNGDDDALEPLRSSEVPSSDESSSEVVTAPGSVDLTLVGRQDAVELGSNVPSLADVQAELGESDHEGFELAVWDTLMRPR